MSEYEKAILQVLDTYRLAVYEKNVEKFISIYDQNVIIFDMWNEWSYKGIDAWRGMVIDWFGSLGNERVIVEFNNPQIISEQSIAFVHSFVTFKAVSSEGNVLRSLQNRFTFVIKNMAGTWKVLHEHSSSPLDFATQKAIFHFDK
jgi:ketosteroid isomerase-like protein